MTTYDGYTEYTNLYVSGALKINSFEIVEDIDIDGDLDVGDNVTVGGDVAVTGGVTVTGGLAVTGTSLLANPQATFSIGTHDYEAGVVDWTLSSAELLKTVQKPTNASGGVNAIIADTAGIPYIFINGTEQALTVKTASGTGVAITSAKTAIVMSDGTNVIALAAESA